MKVFSTQAGPVRRLTASLVLTGVLGTLGCQADYGGQTLPSPWYLYDDVQYFAPGPQMKVAREAAAMREAAAEQDALD